MSRLLDIIQQTTARIPDTVVAEEQNRQSETEGGGEKAKPAEKPNDRKQIELAAEINTNLVAMLLETPLHAYNNIANYKLKRRKARRDIDDEEKQEKELTRIEKVYTENKSMIDLDDTEFSRLKKIMTLKAEKDGGKVNESLDLWGTIISMAVKRAQIFIPD